jgi:hypothetical protein
MMTVVVFLVLFLVLLGLAYRTIGGVLRTATVHAGQVQRDEGCLLATARGLALLETGVPPANPFVCGLSITTSTGPRAVTVTFVRESASGKQQVWSVYATPTKSNPAPQPMPTTFFQPPTP